MTESPKIGLVTVLYNGKEVLPGFFESLSNQTFSNFILYVIDNSPDNEAIDEARQLSRQYNIPAVFIKNDDNYGIAKGNNQGIEEALKDKCRYVLLLNNDIEFSGDSIEKLVDYAVNNNEFVVVPKIYYFGTNKIWMAGGEILKLKGTTIHYGYGKEDDGLYDKLAYVSYSPTCFMLIDVSVFQEVGLMDEIYFVYYDDTDFVYRMCTKGYRILYLPDVKIYHKVSFSTGGGESKFSLYYKTRNRVFFNLKNFSFIYKVSALGYLFLTRILRMPKYSLELNKIIFKAIYDGFILYSKNVR